MKELIEKVEHWAIERNLHTASPHGQTLKVIEEFTETLIAFNDDNKEEVIDGIGDTYVTLIILCKQLGIKFSIPMVNMYFWDDEQEIQPAEVLNWLVSGVAKKNNKSTHLGITGLLMALDGLMETYKLTPKHCLSVAYNEIKDRKGMMIDGTFVKYDDLSVEQRKELDSFS